LLAVSELRNEAGSFFGANWSKNIGLDNKILRLALVWRSKTGDNRFQSDYFGGKVAAKRQGVKSFR